MTKSSDQNVDTLPSKAPLLSAETQDQFESLCRELEQDIQPSGVIERAYVHDIAALICDSRSLRRYKTIIHNNSRLAAVRGILEQLLNASDYDRVYDKELDVEDLARSWFDDKDAQTRVAELLGQFQMDEGAIEAEAFRLCSEDLERLDRMLTLTQVRLEKALRFVADYREDISAQLQQAVLDNDEVPLLVAANKRSD